MPTEKARKAIRGLPGFFRLCFASVPADITNPVETLPIYTALFNKLGIAALLCTAIAVAVLPMMNRLSRTHHGE